MLLDDLLHDREAQPRAALFAHRDEGLKQAVLDGGRVAATGLAMIEGDWVGLFDIVTHAELRRRGHARTIVAALLREAWELGARHAYLQVQADNESAPAVWTVDLR